MRTHTTMLAAILMAASIAAPHAARAAAAKAAPADLILYNAKVWTVDDKHPSAEAVAVRGARIVKVGSSKEVLALKGPATRAMDMEGKLVLPGLTTRTPTSAMRPNGSSRCR